MIKYYFSELWNLQKHAKLATFISISIALISVIFVTFSVISILVSSKIDKRLKSRIEVNLFIDDSTSQVNINNIKRQLEAETIIASVTYLSKQKALEKFSAETGEEFKELLESNPFPASFQLKFKPDKITKEGINNLMSRISKVDGIDETVYNKSYVLELLSFIESSRVIIYLIALVLIIISVYLIYTTSILVLNTKIEQYETMKLVGAKLSALKIPIYLNGLLIGLFTAFFGIIFYSGGSYIIKKMFSFNYLNDYNYYLLILIPLTSFIMGTLGAFFAARKINLKVKSF